MSKNDKKKKKVHLDDMLVFSSEKELEEWLKEQGLTLNEFVDMGGTVEKATENELEELVNDLLDEALGKVEEANISYLTEEQYNVFKDLNEEEQKQYLEQLDKGLS